MNVVVVTPMNVELEVESEHLVNLFVHSRDKLRTVRVYAVQ